MLIFNQKNNINNFWKLVINIKKIILQKTILNKILKFWWKMTNNIK